MKIGASYSVLPPFGMSLVTTPADVRINLLEIERLIDPIKTSPVSSYSLPYGHIRDKPGLQMYKKPTGVSFIYF